MAVKDSADDIAGLSERLREVVEAELNVANQADCRPEDTANYAYAEVCHRAATQLDALLKERDALQARVKELEGFVLDEQLSHGRTAKAAREEVARLQQERDEAYERLKPLVNADALAGVRELVAGWNGEGRPDGPYMRHRDELGATLPETNCGAVYQLDDALKAARDLVRSLASGPEKEKKE